MNTSERNHRLPQTLLLAPDLRQTVLAELDHGGFNRLAYTPYGAQSAQQPVATGLAMANSGTQREAGTTWEMAIEFSIRS